MKVKTISRVSSATAATDVFELNKTMPAQLHKNMDPALHPFERAREYTRTLNTVKLNKLFSKPFLGALDGHVDSVSCLSTQISAHSRESLVTLYSGSCDGEIRFWNLQSQTCTWNVYGHTGFVRGLTIDPSARFLFSCSDDRTIKQWHAVPQEGNQQGVHEPYMIYNGTQPFLGIDHHWQNNLFATCGNTVSIWDHARSEPIQDFNWGSDSIVSVKFNPAEVNLLASTGTDRNICLYDTRMAESLRKVVLTMRSNALAWNPMEPFHFTVANEDHNLYTFDMRKLDRASVIHRDHVGAVLDVSYSPTGQEFVTGSYDRMIRIFPSKSSKSREVYHTKRMQRIFSVKFSADAKYVLSGSDDTNIRLWKAEGSARIGPIAPRERRKIQYGDALKSRFEHLPEIRRIAKHRHVPKFVKKAHTGKQEVLVKEQRKQENRKRHAKSDAFPLVGQKKKIIIKVLE